MMKLKRQDFEAAEHVIEIQKRAKSRKEGFRSQVALAKFRFKQGRLFFWRQKILTPGFVDATASHDRTSP